MIEAELTSWSLALHRCLSMRGTDMIFQEFQQLHDDSHRLEVELTN
jgi:hypothetical protein